MQTIKDFCPVTFYLFYSPAQNTSRNFLYCLGKKTLMSKRKFSTLEENSQLLGKFSTLGENSNSRAKFSNLGENSQPLRKFSTQLKIKFSTSKKKILQSLTKHYEKFTSSFNVQKTSAKTADLPITFVIHRS